MGLSQVKGSPKTGGGLFLFPFKTRQPKVPLGGFLLGFPLTHSTKKCILGWFLLFIPFKTRQTNGILGGFLFGFCLKLPTKEYSWVVLFIPSKARQTKYIWAISSLDSLSITPQQRLSWAPLFIPCITRQTKYSWFLSSLFRSKHTRGTNPHSKADAPPIAVACSDSARQATKSPTDLAAFEPRRFREQQPLKKQK